MNQAEQDWLRLHITPGLGRAGLLRLIQAFGSAAEALAHPPERWVEQAGIRPDIARGVPPPDAPSLLDTIESLTSMGVRLISIWDEADYPRTLRTLTDPPVLLYRRGTWNDDRMALAVVGARKASPNGRIFTRELCREVARYGLIIVSGLARGIDSCAHLGALDADGSTAAVLGCGIDQVYPPENQALFQKIAEKGAIFSEYPPGAPPLAGHFPGRNRIISGLCAGTLVVEAAAGSGSLITVDFALEQGREVFAVPGPVTSEVGSGVNQLLKDGAHLVTEARDILDVLCPGVHPRSPAPTADDSREPLLPEQENLLRIITSDPTHIDDLARESALTPMEVSDILLHLELAGWVEQRPGARFVRIRNR